MLTIVGWLWWDEKCQTQYVAEHANTWARMIHRNTTIPHRFVLMTDQPECKYDPLITAVPLWTDWHKLRPPEWREEFPQCFVRLKAFSQEVQTIFGDRFVSVDLDCVVTGNLDSIFGRVEDFVICKRSRTKKDELEPWYQASMFMMNTGAREAVWTEFRGEGTFQDLREKYGERASMYLGTDQGWMLHVLGKSQAVWTMEDGVYFWPWLKHKQRSAVLPNNTKIVFFSGKEKPWDLLTWLKENYH